MSISTKIYKQYTSLPFYDNVQKQNRYNALCSAVCDFKLLSKCDDVPAFQLQLDYFGSVERWILKYLDGSPDTIDISSCVKFINKYVKNNYTYLVYDGGSLPSCLSDQLACGRWYMEVGDETTTYYSEVFTVESIEETAPIGRPPINNVWPFYDNQLKQNRYKSICSALCDFDLISPCRNLLPFIIKRVSNGLPILSWTIEAIDGSGTITLDPSAITIHIVGSNEYLIYNGYSLDNLMCGIYQSIISDGVNTWYSELITIVNEVLYASSSDGLQTDDGIDILTDDGIQLTID